MSNRVVTYEALRAISGYDGESDGPAELVLWLEENRIAYRRGKYGRPWTTLTALDKVLGVGEADAPDAPRRIVA